MDELTVKVYLDLPGCGVIGSGQIVPLALFYIGICVKVGIVAVKSDIIIIDINRERPAVMAAISQHK